MLIRTKEKDSCTLVLDFSQHPACAYRVCATHIIEQQTLDCVPELLMDSAVLYSMCHLSQRIDRVRIILADEVALEESCEYRAHINIKQQIQRLRLQLIELSGLDQDEISFNGIKEGTRLYGFALRAELVYTLKSAIRDAGLHLDMLCISRQLNRVMATTSCQDRAQRLASLSSCSPSIINFVAWRRYVRNRSIARELKVFACACIFLSVLIFIIRVHLYADINTHRDKLGHIQGVITDNQRQLLQREHIYIELKESYSRWYTWQQIQQHRASYLSSWQLLDKITTQQAQIHATHMQEGMIQVDSHFVDHQHMAGFIDWLGKQQGVDSVHISGMDKGSNSLATKLDIKRNTSEAGYAH